jgi:hypothetical protein
LIQKGVDRERQFETVSNSNLITFKRFQHTLYIHYPMQRKINYEGREMSITWGWGLLVKTVVNAPINIFIDIYYLQ